MSNLNSFAELMQQAAKEKKLRELTEKARKETIVAPLLSELFSTIQRGKDSRQEVLTKESPLLEELQLALSDPEKFKSEKQDKKDKILKLVSELEESAADIKDRVEVQTESAPTPNKESVTDLEKKFLTIFNKLQNDFQTLKKYVDNKANQLSGAYGGTSGSGEVRILRMDDVVRGANPEDGAVMTWDASLSKFKFVVPLNNGVITIISDEEMPFAKRIDFINDDLIYKGEAAVGTSETSSEWRIRQFIIGLDGDITEKWAGGTALYDKKWSDHLVLSYT
jgi:hypothetical protein